MTPEERLEDLTVAHRRALGEAPHAVTDAAQAEFRARVRRRSFDLARLVLVLAGLGGLALDLPVLLGGATHTSQDVAVLHAAMAIGFLVAAWRPAAYARGLAPAVVAAAVLLALPTTSASPSEGLAAELSHLPVLAGAAALLLGGWTTAPLRRRARRAS